MPLEMVGETRTSTNSPITFRQPRTLQPPPGNLLQASWFFRHENEGGLAHHQAPLRRQIKAKPAGAQPCGVTSATARRILQSLERMSSPLADAKRIPSTVSSPLSTSLDGSTLDRSHFPGPKKTAVAGPSQSTSSSLPTYPLSSTPAASSTGSGGGKVKRERTSTRPSSKRPEDEIAELPALPAISLLINTSISLPSFSFSTTKPTATVTSTPVLEEPVTNEVPLTTAPSTPPSTPFTFSSPIVMTTATSPPSFSPSSGFTFSAPVVKTVKHAASESMEEIEGPFKPAKVLKTGQCAGPPQRTWVCRPCYSDLPCPQSPPGEPQPCPPPPPLGTCSKCQQGPGTQRPTVNPFATVSGLEGSTTTTTTTAAGFGALFTKPAGSWDCDTCLVQNKPQVVKCVACETAKAWDWTGVKATLTLPAFSEAKTLPAAAPPPGLRRQV
ncbi:hypothetical protein J4Q44_G00034670 [Coregonus suidteri]|uniref:Nuclear pore complex protein Nup153 n=1 Tax=Coregonus suidteri TaxID=861788 RepID=A0AAN8MIR1_9TELE